MGKRIHDNPLVRDAVRFEIGGCEVKAQARNLKFEIMASNPPFGKLNKYTMEQIRKYLETNIVFLARRKAWLDEVSKPPHPHSEEMIGQALKIIEEKTGQLAFF
jgi:hypothetical protein